MTTGDAAGALRVCVLGGGFAGAFAARHLVRRLPRTAQVELISERNYFVFQPLLPEVAAGTINALDAVTPLRQMLPGVHVRMGEVRAVNFEARTVELVQGSKRKPILRPYDHLVLALGQRTNVSMLPGFAEHGFCVRDLNDAHRLRNHVLQCLEHADVTRDPTLKRRLLTFVVAGGGFSGVEVVGELSEMIERTLPAYPNIEPAEVRTVIVQRGTTLLPELPARLGAYAARKLQRRGVEVRLRTTLRGATNGSVVTDTDTIDCKTLVTTVGSVPTDLVASLAIPKERGRVLTDDCLRVQGHTHVWALGDAALVPLTEGQGGAQGYAPTTAQFAVAEAKALAQNVAALANGQAPRPFRYSPRGTMASIGRYRAVAEVFGVRLSGLVPWLLWRGFYLSMLPGHATRLRVALNWAFDYVLPRSIVQTEAGGHAGVERVCFAAGEALFEPGQFVDGFYVVLQGALESRVPATEAGEDFVRRLGPGDHWGERTLQTGFRTQGWLVATEDTTILRLRRDDYRLLVDALPPLAEYFRTIPDKIYPQQLRYRTEELSS